MHVGPVNAVDMSGIRCIALDKMQVRKYVQQKIRLQEAQYFDRGDKPIMGLDILVLNT